MDAKVQSVFKEMQVLEHDHKRDLAQIDREAKTEIDYVNHQAELKRNAINKLFNVEHHRILERMRDCIDDELACLTLPLYSGSSTGPLIIANSRIRPSEFRPSDLQSIPLRNVKSLPVMDIRHGHPAEERKLLKNETATSRLDPALQVKESKATSRHPLVVCNKDGQWVELRCTMCDPAVNAHIDRLTGNPVHIKGLKGFAAHLANSHPELGPRFPHYLALEHCSYKVLDASEVQELMRGGEKAYAVPVLMKGKPLSSQGSTTVANTSVREYQERVNSTRSVIGKHPVRPVTPYGVLDPSRKRSRCSVSRSVEAMSDFSDQYEAKTFTVKQGLLRNIDALFKE
ncbi:hypothetical protein BDV96DRAFT_688940 [Lophiotrema nucula]|uniref:Uncharacterized protein n=1 Tax=Lophiotrema nucula TaxID=690887 RepID=A0A6A5Z1N3_9PLEO|nr:hypothetical protein BDV96DRAFT_688940 [Lophiotrema nucula]